MLNKFVDVIPGSSDIHSRLDWALGHWAFWPKFKSVDFSLVSTRGWGSLWLFNQSSFFFILFFRTRGSLPSFYFISFSFSILWTEKQERTARWRGRQRQRGLCGAGRTSSRRCWGWWRRGTGTTIWIVCGRAGARIDVGMTWMGSFFFLPAGRWETVRRI